jgi:hypothetical protein
MKLSGNILILSVERGKVLLFSNPRFDDENSKHYHVTLNPNTQETEILYFLCASSQVEKVKKRARYRKQHKDTIVEIDPKDCDTFRLPTVLDCNQVYPFPKEVIVKGLDRGLIEIKGTIPEEVVRKALQGIAKSTQVETEVKESLDIN